MKFLEQQIKGVFLIQPESFVDDRGLFRRNFCQNEFREHGLFSEICQTNISENPKAFTLRGFHFQHPPKAESKVIHCMRGSICDIVVDLRQESATYLQWRSFKLSANSREGLVIPAGCANAWMTLENDTWIFYYHSEFYSPGLEGGIRYDDPLFGFQWPRKPEVISEKDKSYPDFSVNKVQS